jgi:hypothetical protein
MGYSLSWLAVESGLEQAVVDRFGLSPTGETSDHAADFKVSTARLPGWFLLVWESDHLIDSALLSELSNQGRVVAVFVEEHVMFSSAEEWRHGQRLWGAAHVTEVDLYHIGVTGELPASYASIHKEELDVQNSAGGKNAGVDHIFEIPVRLAEEIVGYRHDSAGDEFQENKMTRPTKTRPVQLPIDGVSAITGVIDKKASRWYQENNRSSPASATTKTGFFGRLFGKG